MEEAIEEGKGRHWAVVPSKRKKEEEKNFLCKKKKKYRTERRERGRRKRYFIAQVLNNRLECKLHFSTYLFVIVSEKIFL